MDDEGLKKTFKYIAIIYAFLAITLSFGTAIVNYGAHEIPFHLKLESINNDVETTQHSSLDLICTPQFLDSEFASFSMSYAAAKAIGDFLSSLSILFLIGGSLAFIIVFDSYFFMFMVYLVQNVRVINYLYYRCLVPLSFELFLFVLRAIPVSLLAGLIFWLYVLVVDDFHFINGYDHDGLLECRWTSVRGGEL